MRKHMVARRERLKDRHGRTCAGGECGSGRTALKRADPAFQGVAVGIVVTRVHETARVCAFGVTLERRGKVNWSSNSSGCRINGVSGMNSKSFNFHVGREVTVSTK